MTLPDRKHTDLHFAIDYNGTTGTIGRYGGLMPMIEWLIANVIDNSLGRDPRSNEYYSDPGIAIYLEKEPNSFPMTMIDTIYWRKNPERIYHYFPDSTSIKNALNRQPHRRRRHHRRRHHRQHGKAEHRRHHRQTKI